ncbi:hypothetical protein SpCBS45565_g07392 [Spizellomyces sp. 'palustris']|nr:hypothetical protein SpCBS45565_g07392 [Spizellomyces sp. 'palustris']
MRSPFICFLCCFVRARDLPTVGRPLSRFTALKSHRRRLHCHSTSASSAPEPASACTTTSSTHTTNKTNDALRLIFDDPSYWHKNRLRATQGRHRHVGLFGFAALDRPEGFIRAARAAIDEVNQIVERVCAATREHNISEMKKTVKRLDRLSDILCSVVDTAELIRHVHPDGRFVRSANDAHGILSNFMNQLNTHQGLYETLKRVVQDAAISTQFSEQELRVANLLLVDFEKSGIHMPLATRKRFVELQDRILELGQAVVMNAFPVVDSIEVEDPRKKLQGVPENIISSVTVGSRAIIPTSSAAALAVLRMARDEDVRRTMYMAMNSGSKYQVDVLEEMLVKRGELARLLGKESYAQMYLVDKMAETPENVMAFLESLSNLHRPKAQRDLDRLRRLKSVHLGPNASHEVQPWDRFFYSRFISPSAAIAAQPGSADPFHAPPPVTVAGGGSDGLSAYFTVGSTFDGLSRLFKSLYGVTFEPVMLAPGEVWHEDVRKLEVVHETEGKIGTIYCDLFRRGPGEGRKYESAAHFTVRCSRRIDDEEHFGPEFRSGIMRVRDSEKDIQEDGYVKRYQLPIVVLVTAFKKPSGVDHPSLLSLWEVETLFHEMGHAMHSMLARTEFQHIAGTRVPMDFVEVPSIFMENFARSPKVLASFGRHHKTGAPLPPELLRSAQATSSSADAFETQHQLQLALLDQMYHSPHALEPSFDSTSLLIESQRRFNVFPPVPNSAWQVQFTHLFSYGATYYSYFWSRRWVNRIWRRWFENRDEQAWKEGGELVRKELLGWGGGRDPWVGLEKLGVVKEGEREGNFKVELQDLGQGET